MVFPWQEDLERSSTAKSVWSIQTAAGEWVREIPGNRKATGDEANFPLKNRRNHDQRVASCKQVIYRKEAIREYFRMWRERVGDNGVIIIGHPHISWLGDQIGPQTMIYYANDCPELFECSMEAIFEAACVIFRIALEEGIDFMSEAGYGLEMISPSQFINQDVHYTSKLAKCTHDHGGLFWYHNCGKTRVLIRSGIFNQLGADVVETIAPPPEGDNDFAESRCALDLTICTKGNLRLGLLRDGTIEEVIDATRKMLQDVVGYAHIFSTADAVYAETPPENFINFIQTSRKETILYNSFYI